MGYDPSRWRLQLRNAVEIYKATGTKHAIQLAINSVFADTSFDLSGGISELYESYVPHLIYYALATYSPAFNNRDTWTQSTSTKLSIPEYNSRNFDENIRNYVDHILLDLLQTNPENFIFSGTSFPVSKVVNSKNGKTFCFEPRSLKYKDYSYIPESHTEDYNKATLKGALPFIGPDGFGVYVLGKTAMLEEGCGEEKEKVYLEHMEQNKNFVFSYRQHKDFPIPPFEELLYYKDTKITQSLVNRLIDRLQCAGVTEEGVLAVSEYILNNSLRASDDIRSNNNFLLFTSSLQTPPNFKEVLSTSSIGKAEYLSLWSGKSSHFRVSFDATDYNFLSKVQNKSSAFALLDSARVAEKFSPAHAIPLVDAFVSSLDFVVIDSNSSDSLLNYKEGDSGLDSSGAFNNYSLCSVDMRALYPNLNFMREHVDSVYDPLVSSVGAVATTPRNSFRRRDYRNLLPKDGVFFRDGFSMPINLDASTTENSLPLASSSLGFMPLGYVPSAGCFFPVTDYTRDDRGPYDSCESLQSANTFSGVDTSNTFPCRGLHTPATASGSTLVAGGNYSTRDTLPDIYAVYHKLGEEVKLNEARIYVSSNFNASSTEFFKTHLWKNNEQSYANSSTQLSGAFPNSEYAYDQFSLGPDIHKLYKNYTNVFRRHSLGYPELDSDGGPTLFSHTYGPLVYNGKFNVAGSSTDLALETSSMINTDVENVTLVDMLSEVYPGASGILGPTAGIASGTYEVTSYTDMIVPLVGQAEPVSGSVLTVSGGEFRNKYILSGIEFVGTSGAASANNFQIYNLDSSNYNRYKGNYAINNTIIKLKAIDGLPRIRFDLARSTTFSGVFSPPYVNTGPRNAEASCAGPDWAAIDQFTNTANFLSPDHEYKLDIKALTGSESKPIFGESQFGVWIHTGLDADGYYSYWNGSSWVQHDARKITRDAVTQIQSHLFTPEKTHPKEIINCYNKIINSKYLVNNPAIILDLEAYHFDKYSLSFDTNNDNTCGKDLHSYEQEYYVEIFISPNLSEGNDRFLLLDSVSLNDNTLKELANVIPNSPFTTNLCPSTIKTPVCPEELRKLFIFFNKISAVSKGSGLATRIHTDSEGVYNTSGGSRNTYRVHPYWDPIQTPTGTKFNILTNSLHTLHLDN
jgi:hypothetical protein